LRVRGWRGWWLAAILLLAGCSQPQPDADPYADLPYLTDGGAAVVGPAGGIVALGEGLELWVPRGEVAAGELRVSISPLPLPAETSSWLDGAGATLEGAAYRLVLDANDAAAAGDGFDFLLRLAVSAYSGDFVFPFQELDGRVFELEADGSAIDEDWLVLPGRLPAAADAAAVVGLLAYDEAYCLASGGEWVAWPLPGTPVGGYCQAPWGSVWLNAPGPAGARHVLTPAELDGFPYRPAFPELAGSLKAVGANLGNLSLAAGGKLSDPYVMQRIRNGLSYLQPDLLALQEVAGPAAASSLLDGGGYDLFCADYGYDCLAWKGERFVLAAPPRTVLGDRTPAGVGSFMELPAGEDLDERNWCQSDTGAAEVWLSEAASGRSFAALSVHTATGLAATPQIPCREQQLIAFLQASGAAAWDGGGWVPGGAASLWLGDFNIDPARGSAPGFGPEAADAVRLRWLADWSSQAGLPAGELAGVSGLLALREDNLPTHVSGRSYDQALASADLLDGWSCAVPQKTAAGRITVGGGLADRWLFDQDALDGWNAYLAGGGIDLSAGSLRLIPDHRPVYCSLLFAAN